jgi:hypothetical protein
VAAKLRDASLVCPSLLVDNRILRPGNISRDGFAIQIAEQVCYKSIQFLYLPISTQGISPRHNRIMEENKKTAPPSAENTGAGASVHSAFGEDNVAVQNGRLLRKIDWMYAASSMWKTLPCTQYPIG